MTQNKRAATAITLIFAAALYVGYFQLCAAQRAQAARLAIARERAVLDAEIRKLEAAGAREPGKRGTSFGESSRHMASGENGRPKGPSRSASTAAILRGNALLLAAFREGLTHAYGALYQRLGLSPAQVARFEDLLTAHRRRMSDLLVVAPTDGPDSPSPEVTALQREEDDNFRAAQIALLGADGYQELQQYTRLLPAQIFLDRAAQDTGFPPEPITDGQEQQILAIMAKASSGYQNGGPVDLVGMDWVTVLAQAQGILSANQWEGLKTSISALELKQLRKEYFAQGTVR